jgi:hypothetical protein
MGDKYNMEDRYNGIKFEVYEEEGQGWYGIFYSNGEEYRTENFSTVQKAIDAAKELIEIHCD